VAVEPPAPLGREFAEAGALLMMVLGGMLALGGFVVGSDAWVVGSLATLGAGWVLRREVRREK
jgi:hypothetical protein